MSLYNLTNQAELIRNVKQFALSYGSPTHEFTLASGKKSHYYLDLRRLTLSPAVLSVALAIDRILQSGIRYDVIGGPESAANQIIGAYMAAQAASLTQTMTVNGFTVRKEAKDHGTGGMIAGHLKAGDKAVLVEDVATSGGSLLRAINAVEEAGATVVLVIVIVDREQGAREALDARKIQFVPILTQTELLIDPRQPGVNCPLS